MASEFRGVHLLGDKSSNRISAVQVVDSKDSRFLFSPADYRNKGAEPHDFHTLPWEDDVKFKPAEPKPR
jgi:hypothetical protein